VALSDKERDILANMERDLASDPQFVSSMKHSNKMHLGSGKRIIVGTLSLVAGIAVLLTGITANLLVVGVIGFCGMVFGAFWAFSGNAKSPVPSAGVGLGSSGKAKSAFMQNLEDKWEERRNSQN
jgi:hypothetical protein